MKKSNQKLNNVNVVLHLTFYYVYSILLSTQYEKNHYFINTRFDGYSRHSVRLSRTSKSKQESPRQKRGDLLCYRCGGIPILFR